MSGEYDYEPTTEQAEFIAKRKWNELTVDEKRLIARILASTEREIVEDALDKIRKPDATLKNVLGSYRAFMMGDSFESSSQ